MCDMYPKKKAALKILFSLTLAVLLPWSAANAQDERLTVESDIIKFDADTGNSIFEGNVIIARGGLKLFAATVEHIKPEQGDDYIVANGTPVRFTYDAPETDVVTEGSSDQATYMFKKEEIQMLGNVVIHNERTTLNAHEAIYNLQSSEMRVVSTADSEQSSGRLKSTIVIDDN